MSLIASVALGRQRAGRFLVSRANKLTGQISVVRVPHSILMSQGYSDGTCDGYCHGAPGGDQTYSLRLIGGGPGHQEVRPAKRHKNKFITDPICLSLGNTVGCGDAYG